MNGRGADRSGRGHPIASQESLVLELEVDPAGQLRPRGHSNLAECLAQVVLDGARADEQSRRDLFVGVTFRRETSDLELLRSELAQRVDGPFAGMLACCLQFEPCA